MSKLLAGFSEAKLEKPRELIGDGLSSRPCLGVSDPLMVQSLVLDDGNDRVAIIALDLLAVDSEEVEEVCSRIAAQGIRHENVLVAASHTHSGPPSIDFGHVNKSEELAVEVAEKAEQTVAESIRSLSPVSLRSGFSHFPNSVNRRQINWIGKATLGVNPRGPADHQLNYLLLETVHGRLLLISYGVHPVINKKIPFASADYIAGIRQVVSSAGITATLFLNGALGDVSPYDRQNQVRLNDLGIETALRYGSQMGQEVLNCLSSLGLQKTGISSASCTLGVRLDEVNDGIRDWKLTVQAIRIGELVLVSFPGEIFAQTALDLRRRCPGQLAVVSCANGYMGYLPPEPDYARGGYEVKYAPRFIGYRIPKGLAEAFRSTAEKLVSEVRTS